MRLRPLRVNEHMLLTRLAVAARVIYIYRVGVLG
jgi:hypothetical protein